MQKFLNNSTTGSSSGSAAVIDITASSSGFDITTCTAEGLIDSALEGVALADKMTSLNNLQTMVLDCSTYLTELIKIESKRLVLDSRYYYYFFRGSVKTFTNLLFEQLIMFYIIIALVWKQRQRMPLLIAHYFKPQKEVSLNHEESLLSLFAPMAYWLMERVAIAFYLGRKLTLLSLCRIQPRLRKWVKCFCFLFSNNLLLLENVN
jgi:hypothetical protein